MRVTVWDTLADNQPHKLTMYNDMLCDIVILFSLLQTGYKTNFEMFFLYIPLLGQQMGSGHNRLL